ncbi:MAG TPA: adenosylcobinamide-GDP ribazoletransferase [Candidatus Limnocylindrales bacterium]
MRRFSAGLRLALTTFTVAPVRGPQIVDRPAAGWAMRLAPAAGALLGLVLAGVLWLLRLADAPALLCGVVLAALAALLTRGLHLDGLADTVDGLGSYRSREEALRIMKSPEVGPFGVVAIVLVLMVQAATFGGLELPELVGAVAAGRLAASLGCFPGVPAARPEGLGALVAGTAGPVSLVVNALWVALLAGMLPVLAVLVVTAVLMRHVVRRFGGITGDVLGFLIEVGTAVALLTLALL